MDDELNTGVPAVDDTQAPTDDAVADAPEVEEEATEEEEVTE